VSHVLLVVIILAIIASLYSKRLRSCTLKKLRQLFVPFLNKLECLQV